MTDKTLVDPDDPSAEILADIFPNSIKFGTASNHPHTVAAKPNGRAVAALRSYVRADRQKDETEALCASAEIRRLDDHPMARAIGDAWNRLVYAEGDLWSAIQAHHRWAVVVDGDHYAYVEGKGPRDGRDRPRVIVGRVDQPDAPNCVKEFIKDHESGALAARFAGHTP